MVVELRGFSDEYAVLVAGWAVDAKEVALLSGRVEYPFPEELKASWRKVDPDIHSYLLFDGDQPVGYGEVWLDDEEDEVELARIIVDPKVRGRGIGPGVGARLARAGGGCRVLGGLPPGPAGERGRDPHLPPHRLRRRPGGLDGRMEPRPAPRLPLDALCRRAHLARGPLPHGSR